MPDPHFDPSRFTGTVNCVGGHGAIECGGGFVGLALSVNGDGGGLFALTVMGERGQPKHIYMGAAEWKQFVAAVRFGEQTLEQLIAGGKCDELTPVCPS